MATTSTLRVIVETNTRQLDKLQGKFKKTETEVAKLQGKLKGPLSSAFRSVGNAGQRAGRKIQSGFDRAAKGAAKLQGKLGGLRTAILGLGIGAGVRKAFGDAAGLESAETRINGLITAYSKFDGVQAIAAKSAEKFRLTQTEALATYAELGSRLGGTSVELKDLENIFDGFNTLLVNNKVGAQQAAAAQLQLGQALGEGVLRTEEYNSLIANTPQLLDEVARVLDVPRAGLKKLAGEGKISSEALIQALANIKTKGADQLEKSFESAFGASRDFQKALSELSVAIGQELVPAIIPLLKFATKLLELFGKLPKPARSVAVAVTAVGTAAFFAAPGIKLLGGALAFISGAGLLAAGPWLALAAGIGAVVVALGQYQSKSGQIAQAARTGGARQVVAARQELSKLSADNSLNRLKIKESSNGRERQRLKGEISKNVKRINDLRSAIAANPADIQEKLPKVQDPELPTLDGGGLSGGGSSGGGGGGGSQASEELKRQQEALDEQLKTSKDLRIEADNRLLVAKAVTEQDRIALQGLVKKDEIERKYAKLLTESLSSAETKNLLAAKGLETDLAKLETENALKALQEGAVGSLIEENELLEARLEGKEEEYLLEKKIADLKKQGIPQQRATELVLKNKELKEQVAAMENLKAKATEVAGVISSEFTGALKSVIQGTKTAQEAFADMFQGIAERFLDMALKILQDAITQQLVNLFKGLLTSTGGGAGGFLAPGGGLGIGDSSPFNLNAFGGFFAEGGTLGAGKWGIAGEAGAELISGPASITPLSQMGGDGGVVNVVTNINVEKGSGSTTVSGGSESDRAAQLGKMVERSTMAIIAREKRPGGLLRG